MESNRSIGIAGPYSLLTPRSGTVGTGTNSQSSTSTRVIPAGPPRQQAGTGSGSGTSTSTSSVTGPLAPYAERTTENAEAEGDGGTRVVSPASGIDDEIPARVPSPELQRDAFSRKPPARHGSNPQPSGAALIHQQRPPGAGRDHKLSSQPSSIRPSSSLRRRHDAKVAAVLEHEWLASREEECKERAHQAVMLAAKATEESERATREKEIGESQRLLVAVGEDRQVEVGNWRPDHLPGGETFVWVRPANVEDMTAVVQAVRADGFPRRMVGEWRIPTEDGDVVAVPSKLLHIPPSAPAPSCCTIL